MVKNYLLEYINPTPEYPPDNSAGGVPSVLIDRKTTAS